jgi:F420-non-reducing hydrogenase iron-sulfur subunit
MGLDDRLHLDWISSAEAQRFVQVVTDFTEKIKELGPNPLSDERKQPKSVQGG